MYTDNNTYLIGNNHMIKLRVNDIWIEMQVQRAELAEIIMKAFEQFNQKITGYASLKDERGVL